MTFPSKLGDKENVTLEVLNGYEIWLKDHGKEFYLRSCLTYETAKKILDNTSEHATIKPAIVIKITSITTPEIYYIVSSSHIWMD